MTYQTLVSTQILAAHLNDPSWRIIDVRFDLAAPQWGRTNYGLNHIPGALYADLNQDLAAPQGPQTGRHPLPDPQKFSATLQAWGVAPGVQVVVYDTSGGGYAGRLWWMLRAIGHMDVALLDGGFPAWLAEGLPTASGSERAHPAPTAYPPTFTHQPWLTSSEVDAARSDPNVVLVDARAPERFRGEIELIDPLPGHIPGAFNRYYGLNLGPDGKFKPLDQLQQEFESLLGRKQPQNAIVYCGSGVTSCHHLLVMEMLGLSGARLYPGSWSEWIRDPARPHSKGE